MAEQEHQRSDTNQTAVKPPRYDFRAFEAKWREHWEASGMYRADVRHASRPYYNLMMFPYPSAEGLHVGNVYAFVGADIHGRFMAAQGYDVFEPMGFDAFGIHSENFAIKQGLHPAALTARNVERFREQQLKRIGNRYDWSHEVNTTDPRYYKWTQWIFTQLFNAGLAERKQAAVNWCPKDKTVLADEQVIDGRCERCDSIVERRELEQWFLRTTDYADRLLANLPTLDWPERVKVAQRNWIGRTQSEDGSVQYHMRDWLISRQRYWGAPIPIVYCPEHGAVAVPEEQLPVLLPDLEDYVPSGTGDSPLAKIPAFVATTCPVCGGPARRETDVMDNFVDSAWYFLRYPSSDDADQAWDDAITRKWLPVSMYIGGAEHSVLHLLYARFITMALHDLGKLPFEEPFTRFRAHGLMIKDGAKISKSRGNVINPDDYLETFGTDVLRTYLMFMGPYEAGGDFSDRGIGGVVRFLDRVWHLAESETDTRRNAENTECGERTQTSEETPRTPESRESRESRESQSTEKEQHTSVQPAQHSVSASTNSISPSSARSASSSAISAFESRSEHAVMHATIKRVTEEVAALKYNTAIAALMEYVNVLESQPVISREELRTLLVLLAPFAPFVTEELWERLGEHGSIHRQRWPDYDEAMLRRERMTLVVQVDGRVRDRIELSTTATEDEVRAAALASEKVRRVVGDRAVREVIYVSGRLANVVTAREGASRP